MTSFIELLELPNFVPITTTTRQSESRDKILQATLLTEILTSF